MDYEIKGKIKWKENIYERLESAPKAFVSLFRGKSMGRILVKIDSSTFKS